MIRSAAKLSVVEQLYLDRTDITFQNTARDQVEIGVTVRNPSTQWSVPAIMVVQAAPLGAFVPWSHLTSVDVPGIEPWGQVQVETRVPIPQSTPLGNLEEVTPQQLLNTLDRPQVVIDELFDGLWIELPIDLEMIGSSLLPDDPMALLGRPNPHWAGNINVFVGDCAVERHRTQALRIYPGRTNLAVFLVGSGRDAYAFQLTGVEPDWEAKLYSMTTTRSVLNPESGPLIPQIKWIDGRKVRLVRLSISPPQGCSKGEVAVHVTQKSTRKTALIEFSLDPHTAGPGCFTI